MPSTPRHHHEDRRRYGSGVEADLFAGFRSHHSKDAPQQINPNYKPKECIPSPSSRGAASGRWGGQRPCQIWSPVAWRQRRAKRLDRSRPGREAVLGTIQFNWNNLHWHAKKSPHLPLSATIFHGRRDREMPKFRMSSHKMASHEPWWASTHCWTATGSLRYPAR